MEQVADITDLDAPMSARLSKYMAGVCVRTGREFDPRTTRTEARTLVLSQRGEYMTRAEGRRVGCPNCDAASAQPCVDVDGVARERNHAERVQLARFERVAG